MSRISVAIIWIGGLIAYFALTSERQRENNLLIMWPLLGGAAILPIITFLV